MKSKSFELPKNSPEEENQNKKFDFIKYYKPAPESSNSSINVSKVKTPTSKRVISPNKNKKKIKKEMDISQINIDGSNLSFGAGNSSSSDIHQVTSTPNIAKKFKNSKVKSIMKNSVDDAPNVSFVNESNTKAKKRNKSVSFMLDENEIVAIKKSKSEESVSDKVQNGKMVQNSQKTKKQNYKTSEEKENKSDVNNLEVNIVKSEKSKKKALKTTMKEENSPNVSMNEVENQSKIKQDKKTRKRNKKPRSVESSSKSVEDVIVSELENIKKEESQIKKTKKKKRHSKPSQHTTNTEIDEPASKSLKKELKPEAIAEGLENLNIGDNPHSLTSLIDEMTVVDKKKKIKHQKKKTKPQNETSTPLQESESVNTDKVKVKWLRRKFNKDKKGTISEDKLSTSIIVENLPFSVMCTYKKLLSEHFNKFGIVQQVCVAEVYPTEDPKPVFTTTVVFYSEDAAVKSLEEDNTLFKGNRIRVKRPLPPTQTTIMVRSYAELSLQALSTLFSSAGRIRNIRNILKGRKTMAAAFVEFDGPEAVHRALKLSEKAKIGGKKIHVAKYEFRKTNHNKESKTNNANDDTESDTSDN